MNKILTLSLILSLISCVNKTKKPEIQQELKNTTELMTDTDFWKIIDITKINCNNDYQSQIENLRIELDKLSPSEIIKFDNKLMKLRGEALNWDLWAIAYIMNQGCSDDCFIDFREWLIAHGKQIYKNALLNPESISNLNFDIENDDLEGLGNIALEVYEEKTGKEIPSSFKENSKITGQQWDENTFDFKSKFPKTFQKWGQ